MICQCPQCHGPATIARVRGAVYADCADCGRNLWRAVFTTSPPAVRYPPPR